MLPARDVRKIMEMIRAAVGSLPDPSVTLVGKKWKSPYLVLISCLLSLRTKDSTTLPASLRLFELADNPADMVRLTIREIEKAVFPVGFYRTKARRIKDISQDLLTRFNGQVPDTLDGLLSLKGVGRKTANLVLVEGFGLPGICVDTHVHRISNRFGFIETRSPEETEMILRKKLQPDMWKDYNSLLVLWGQNVCRPVSPKCETCPANGLCLKAGVGHHR